MTKQTTIVVIGSLRLNSKLYKNSKNILPPMKAILSVICDHQIKILCNDYVKQETLWHSVICDKHAESSVLTRDPRLKALR